MVSVPGVGVWTAAETAHRALGDADAVSFGDYHVAKNVGWALTGEAVDDDGMAELLARIEALLRRAPSSSVPAEVYQFGDVHVDFRKAEISKAGQLLEVSAREFKLLKYFIAKAHGGRRWVRPRIVIGLPSSVTEVERRAVEEASLRAGARRSLVRWNARAAGASNGGAAPRP